VSNIIRHEQRVSMCLLVTTVIGFHIERIVRNEKLKRDANTGFNCPSFIWCVIYFLFKFVQM